MEKLFITEDIVVSHSICTRKSFQLLFHRDEGEETKYAKFLNDRMQCVENEFFHAAKNCLHFSIEKMTGKADVILNARIEVDNLVVNKIHLQQRKGNSKLGSYYYEPLIFSLSNK